MCWRQQGGCKGWCPGSNTSTVMSHRRTKGPILGTSLLLSPRVHIKGLPGIMNPDIHYWFSSSLNFGIMHMRILTLSQAQKQTGVLWMARSTKDHSAHSGSALVQRQLRRFCLQHVCSYNLKVSKCELLWWHDEAERNGSDLQDTVWKCVNPFLPTAMSISHGWKNIVQVIGCPDWSNSLEFGLIETHKENYFKGVKIRKIKFKPRAIFNIQVVVVIEPFSYFLPKPCFTQNWVALKNCTHLSINQERSCHV